MWRRLARFERLIEGYRPSGMFRARQEGAYDRPGSTIRAMPARQVNRKRLARSRRSAFWGSLSQISRYVSTWTGVCPMSPSSLDVFARRYRWLAGSARPQHHAGFVHGCSRTGPFMPKANYPGRPPVHHSGIRGSQYLSIKYHRVGLPKPGLEPSGQAGVRGLLRLNALAERSIGLYKAEVHPSKRT